MNHNKAQKTELCECCGAFVVSFVADLIDDGCYEFICRNCGYEWEEPIEQEY